MIARPLAIHPYELASLVRQATEAVIRANAPDFRGTIYITIDSLPIKREHVSVQFREPAVKAGMKM